MSRSRAWDEVGLLVSQFVSWRGSQIVFSQLSSHTNLGLDMVCLIFQPTGSQSLYRSRVYPQPGHTFLAQAHELSSAPVSMISLFQTTYSTGGTNQQIRLRFPELSLQSPSRKHGRYKRTWLPNAR